MTADQFRDWVRSKGWSIDAYGHAHKGGYRFKVQTKSVRLERSYQTPDTDYSKGEKGWLRVRSAYLSKLTLNNEGKLQGMKP